MSSPGDGDSGMPAALSGGCASPGCDAASVGSQRQRDAPAAGKRHAGVAPAVWSAVIRRRPRQRLWAQPTAAEPVVRQQQPAVPQPRHRPQAPLLGGFGGFTSSATASGY